MSFNTEKVQEMVHDPVLQDGFGLILMAFGGLQFLGFLTSLLKGKPSIPALSQTVLYGGAGAMLYLMS